LYRAEQRQEQKRADAARADAVNAARAAELARRARARGRVI